MTNILRIANNKDLCCGCNACSVMCPEKAIIMVADKCGHRYPEIDKTKCKDCSLCLMVCCEDNVINNDLPLQSIAATNLKKTVSNKSSSGGIFAALAEKVISEGGIVYGTCLTESFEAKVIGIDSESDLYRIQGSKYVRSEMGDIYLDIEANLKMGRLVLFSGVPCQVAAVRLFTQNRYENLITIDIVCHGTPSNQLFRDYIDFLKMKKNASITSFLFRDKRFGQDHVGSIVFEYHLHQKTRSKTYKLHSFRSSYYKLFLNCATFRQSCYLCKFAEPKRVGDITLCDYWGIGEHHPGFVEEVSKASLSGISAVMINSEKGRVLLHSISEMILQIPTDYSFVRENNPQLNKASTKPTYYDELMRKYEREGYLAIEMFYRKRFRVARAKSTIGRLLPGKMRKKLVEIGRRIAK